MPDEFGFHRGIDRQKIAQQEQVTALGSAAVQDLGNETSAFGLGMQRLGAFAQGFQKACRTQLASGSINSFQHNIPFRDQRGGANPCFTPQSNQLSTTVPDSRMPMPPVKGQSTANHHAQR